MQVYTIGFTQKHAEDFYEKIKKEKIDLLVDVRLNNTSQLASFSKFPDIVYFLDKLCNVRYRHDTMLSPTDDLLKNYKKGIVSWEDYEKRFAETMEDRKITEYLSEQYGDQSMSNICLLCSEATAEKCHRRLVAEYFSKVFGAEIIHL